MKKIQINTEKRNLWIPIMIFLLATLPRVIFCLFMIPVGVLSDETATISGAAYLAGYDWSQVIQHAGYYGTGFTALMAPLFMATDDPVIIYRGIGMVCAVLQGASSLIAYRIFTKYFSIEKILFVAVAAVASSYLVTDCSIIIFNEHPLVLCSWIIAWLLLYLQKNLDNKKKKIRGTLFLFLVLGYSLTLHTRAIAFWLAAGIAVLFYAWLYRRCLISIPASVISGGVFAAAGTWYVQCIQGKLWIVDSASGMRNAEIYLSGGPLQLLDPQNWQAWANIVIGQIHTVGVFTGGIFILFFVIFTHLLWKALLRRKELLGQDLFAVERGTFPVIVFCMAGIAMTMLGQSFSWLTGSREVIAAGFENDLYATKAYGYLRYFGPFCGPLFCICCVWLYKRREQILKYFRPALAALLVCEAYWMICIVPYIYHCGQIGVFNFYFPFSLWTLDKETRLLALLPASVILFISFILCWVMVKKKHQWVSVLFVCGIFVEVYFFIGIAWDREFMKDNWEIADESYGLIKSLEEKIDIPDTIYVQDARDWMTDQFTYYEYQFLLNRYTIIPEVPEDTVEEAVFFTNMVYTDNNYHEWTSKGYAYLVLDEDELLLVKGEKLQSEFREAGVALKE